MFSSENISRKKTFLFFGAAFHRVQCVVVRTNVRLRCPKFVARCSLRQISTAAPSAARFIVHRTRSATHPSGTRRSVNVFGNKTKTTRLGGFVCVVLTI